MIPKIIHQIWFQGSSHIPNTYPNYSSSWKQLNPEFRYIFWNKNSINKLLQLYPRLQKQYYSYPLMIQKIDFAKYVILYHYGGVYVDLDAECIKPINNLIKNKKLFLVQFNVNLFEKLFGFRKLTDVVLQNGFMASKPKHSFWLHLFNSLINQDINKKHFETEFKFVFRTTGPLLLTSSYHNYQSKYPNNNITILPYHLIDPISWCNYDRSACHGQSCRDQYPLAYSIHHYGSRHGGWGNNIEQAFGMLVCKHKHELFFLIIILSFIFIKRAYDYTL